MDYHCPVGFHNPFEKLGPMTGRPVPAREDPKSPVAPVVPDAPPSSAAPGVKPIPRAVVRLERSGRGGKEVTVVEHLGIAPKDREVWLKALKSALGCGGVVEGDALVLQGDQRERLPKILSARGVKKITRG